MDSFTADSLRTFPYNFPYQLEAWENKVNQAFRQTRSGKKGRKEERKAKPKFKSIDSF